MDEIEIVRKIAESFPFSVQIVHMKLIFNKDDGSYLADKIIPIEIIHPNET